MFAGGLVPAGQQCASDDPDKDGMPVLVEYAIAGQDPTVSNATVGSLAGPTLSYAKRAGHQRPQLCHRGLDRPRNNGGLDGNHGGQLVYQQRGHHLLHLCAGPCGQILCPAAGAVQLKPPARSSRQHPRR